jgi:hypothetical protein
MDALLLGDRRAWGPFILGAHERAATDAADACEAIRARFEADGRRIQAGRARRLLRRLAEGALPLRHVLPAEDEALRALRVSRIARVAPGLFGDAMVFHAGLARIVGGQRAGVPVRYRRDER